MAETTVRKRAIKAGLDWLWGKAIERWPELVTAVIAGGGMTYLARASAWLAPYGPVAWGGIGLLSMLVVAFAYFLVSLGRARRALSTYVLAKTSAAAVNVLAPIHQDARIELSHFYHPYFQPVENVRFEHCELMGPANVAFFGGTFDHCGFIDCEIVIVREDRLIRGASSFKNCLMMRSKLYRLTLIMNYQSYLLLPGEIRSAVPVISDGRIGDV
jgi:hypothetical protein